jgi:hypothetical protein
MFVQNNSVHYAPSPLDRARSEMAYSVFIGRVLSVDHERMVLSLEDVRDGTVYKEVRIFPSEHSSVEATVVHMPEQFSTCVASHIVYTQGYSQVAIISWIMANAVAALDAVAQRPVSGTVIQGMSDRLRGTYRKAYPGQKTASYTGGYTEKIDTGWDRAGYDFSRDKLDPECRQWTQITGRHVGYSDAGVTFRGTVNRPNATNIIPAQLPDGTYQYVYHLAPGTQPTDRYISGKQDVIPFVENTELTQEFALDYPLPLEILQTDLFDQLLGTTQSPWTRTSIGALPVAGTTSPTPAITTVSASSTPTPVIPSVLADNQTYLIQQGVDHPYDTTKTPVGPTLAEGPTPQRRAFIMERVAGTLVGYNRFDKGTYGYVLKPVLFPYTSQGRFGADVDSSYLMVKDTANHDEARLAASALAIRFPHEYGTTRLDVTKEGFTSMEIGSTIPKENNQFGGGYEHPHGAGRSLEAHFVGSVKAVIGKNRDEEEAIDLQALGQVVLRLGADDQELPDARRSVQTQIRSKADASAQRQLQYWDSGHLGLKTAGDSGVNAAGYNKTGAESVSLRAAMDGAAVIRLGARNPAALRRHLMNGYTDGPGTQAWGVGESGRKDSHTVGRPNYGGGDSKYRFHDMTTAGQPTQDTQPYTQADYQALGSPISANSALSNSAMDQHGLSLDLHSVRDMLIRIGKNPVSGQSLLIDSDGGLVATIGADKQGRSITASFDGGVQLIIQPNKSGAALQIELNGDVNIVHKGNFQHLITGDLVTECTTWRHVSKTDTILTQQKYLSASTARHSIVAPDIVHDQGSQISDPTGGAS